jgi:hypothetical protein
VPLRTDRALEWGTLTMMEEGPAHPFFLELQILKGFKRNVLKPCILKGLRAFFRNCGFQRS